MDVEVKKALSQFFAAQKKLNQLGVIRSRDYVGDIARYLCAATYGLELVERAAGYDGIIADSRVQVGVNNCPTGHPVRLGRSAEWDEALVVLGPNSWLRPESVPGDFIFYRFTREEIAERFKLRGDQYVGGRSVFSRGYDLVLRLGEE